MPASDWFPRRHADLRDWYQNFTTEVEAIAAALKLDAAPAQAGAAAWLAADAAAEAARTALAGATKTAQAQQQPSEDAARAFIKQLKATPGATPAQLEALRCVGPDSPAVVRAAEQPTLALSFDAGHVVVKFQKHGHQGILLQSRRGDEADFTLLGLDTHSPYLDNRPNLVPGQPEERHYRAYFAQADQPTGALSAVATIAVRA